MEEKLVRIEQLRGLEGVNSVEWDAARSLRRRYFFDKVPIADPYEWTFTHKDHIHFILIEGDAIIGYAHIQLWPESRAAIRIVVVEEEQQGRGFGKQFLRRMEEWLRDKGYKYVHTESSSTAVPFYTRLGYTEMPFNDPDGYESSADDTPMGRLL